MSDEWVVCLCKPCSACKGTQWIDHNPGSRYDKSRCDSCVGGLVFKAATKVEAIEETTAYILRHPVEAT